MEKEKVTAQVEEREFTEEQNKVQTRMFDVVVKHFCNTCG